MISFIGYKIKKTSNTTHPTESSAKLLHPEIDGGSEEMAVHLFAKLEYKEKTLISHKNTAHIRTM